MKKKNKKLLYGKRRGCRSVCMQFSKTRHLNRSCAHARVECANGQMQFRFFFFSFFFALVGMRESVGGDRKSAVIR